MSERRKRSFSGKTLGWLNCPTACTAARAAESREAGNFAARRNDPEDGPGTLYRRFDALAKRVRGAAGRSGALEQALR